MTIIVIEEILMANGLTVFMMWFLLLCRRKNRESLHVEDRVYDGMAITNLVGAVSETIAFLVDGQQFIGARQINYVFNSICFISTVSIGLLWCLYVELRIYRNYKRIFHKVRVVMFPWLVEVLMILCNLFGTGIMFIISEDNVYQRATGAMVGYISLIIYFAYSIYLVYHSKRQGVNLNFFPVIYFVGPCFAGVLIQYFSYGITSSWVLVAVALLFIQMQLYAENLYTDELSGLYNRRYLNAALAKGKIARWKSLHGIMMDVNDFKHINDNFGHSRGDKVICILGDILFKSIPDTGMAIRYAGDEFIVLLAGMDTESVLATMEEINQNLTRFNESKAEPFTLSVSMGYTELGAEDDAETFLMRMDEKMYEEKRKYHLLKKL